MISDFFDNITVKFFILVIIASTLFAGGLFAINKFNAKIIYKRADVMELLSQIEFDETNHETIVLSDKEDSYRRTSLAYKIINDNILLSTKGVFVLMMDHEGE